MFERRSGLFASLVLSATLLVGCASGPSLTDEYGTAEDTVAAYLPASQAARDAADRADALTRADFWGREYAKTPEHLGTTLSFIDSLEGIGSHQRIVDIVRDTLPIHPRNTDLLVDLGQALNRLGRHDQSIGAYQSAIDIDGADVDAIAGQALGFDRTGRHERAQALYLRALSLDPLRTSTRTNYGLSLALTGDLDQAEAQLMIAANANDSSPRVRQNLALIQGLKGDFASARETASIDLAPDQVDQNLQTLQAMVTPQRSYEALEALESGAEGEAAGEKTDAKPKKRGLRGL